MRKLGLLLSALSLAACETPQQVSQRHEIAVARAEQALPREAISYDPKLFDRYVGYYQNPARPHEVFTISRAGDRFLSNLPMQRDVEIFPESQTKFFAKEVHAQLSFDTNQQGNVTGLVLHQHGGELHFEKIDDALGKKVVQIVQNEYPLIFGVKCWAMDWRPGPPLCAMRGADRYLRDVRISN